MSRILIEYAPKISFQTKNKIKDNVVASMSGADSNQYYIDSAIAVLNERYDFDNKEYPDTFGSKRDYNELLRLSSEGVDYIEY
jgi:hypothetical protein